MNNAQKKRAAEAAAKAKAAEKQRKIDAAAAKKRKAAKAQAAPTPVPAPVPMPRTYGLYVNGKETTATATVDAGTLTLSWSGTNSVYFYDVNRNGGDSASKDANGLFTCPWPLTPGEAYLRIGDAEMEGTSRQVIECRFTVRKPVVVVPPVTQPEASAPAPIVVTPISAHHAVHLIADGFTEADTIQWLTDTGLERRGFNVAIEREDGSRVTRKVNGVTDATYVIPWPAPPAEKPIAPGIDVCSLKPGVYRFESGGYVATGQLDLTDRTFIGVGDETIIRYTGPQFGWAWASGDRACLRDLRIENNYVYDHTLPITKNPARKECCTGIQPGNDSTFVDVTMVRWNDGFNSNNHPTNVAVIGCIGREQIGNFSWNEATNFAEYDNDCDNSRLEHISRGSGYKRWASNGNRYTNLRHIDDIDPATRDANDDAKGTLVCQYGEQVYLWDNTLVGPWGVHPLSTIASGKPGVVTKVAVVDEQRSVTQAVDVASGTENFRIVSANVVFLLDDDRPIRNGIVPAGTKIPTHARVQNVRTA